MAGSEQDESRATYSIWRNPDDFFVNWSLSSASIRRFVDAVGAPYGGAKCYDNDGVFIIDTAEEFPDVTCGMRYLGKVIFIDGVCPVVICGDGLLKISSGRRLNSPNSYERLIPLKRFRTRFR